MSLFQRIRTVKIANDECNYTAIAFSAMKRTVRGGMYDILKENNDFDDITQDARAAAQEE